MEEGLFTQENCELAARLQGDPNIFHYMNNIYNKVIAPGLMQLQGFVALRGWRPGRTMTVDLIESIFAPNPDAHYDLEHCYHGQKTFSTAEISQSMDLKLPINFDHSYSYNLTKEKMLVKDLKPWNLYSTVPLNLVTRIIPGTDDKTLERVAAVGVSGNALVRMLSDSPEYHPEIYFPGVREEGTEALMVKKLKLTMGDTYNDADINGFTLGVHPLDEVPEKERDLIARVSETKGLYTLELHATRVPLRVLPRMLGVKLTR